MSSTPRFANCDTKKANGFYVQFARVVIPDDVNDPPDQMQDGYWPSTDKNDAGYVRPKLYESEMRKAKERMTAWERGDWYYVGIRAVAHCLIVRNYVGTYLNIESPGLWGIESDAGDYLDEVYQEQIEVLKQLISDLHSPIFESEKETEAA